MGTRKEGELLSSWVLFLLGVLYQSLEVVADPPAPPYPLEDVLFPLQAERLRGHLVTPLAHWETKYFS